MSTVYDIFEKLLNIQNIQNSGPFIYISRSFQLFDR